MQVVVDTEILAPIADELPKLGANFVYDAASGSIRIETSTKEVVELHLGQQVLTKGDTSIKIPAAPIVRNDVLLLPVMQIAAALGAYARVDAAGTLWLNPSLQEVKVETTGEVTELKIALSSPAKFRVGTLTNPDRIYIDAEHVDLRMPPGEIQHKAEAMGLGKVRVAQFSLAPDWCRVVVELAKPLKYEVKSEVETNEFVLRIGEGDKPALDNATAPDRSAPPLDSAVPVVPRNRDLAGLRIVVDAGHGGHDQGAAGIAGTLEKHINLDLAQRLAAQLAQMGANVIMTRSDDYFVTLAGRCKIANESGAQIFVSVHVNSWPRPNGHSGTEVFYTHAPSFPLAKAVHDRMIALLGRKDGGVRQRGLFVTNHTMMPSTLTETAYINHAEEEKLLNDPAFKERAAEAIALGVLDYAREYLLKKLPRKASPPAASTTQTISGRMAAPKKQ